jgi:Leucine-rich repeat (LRR) protein
MLCGCTKTSPPPADAVTPEYQETLKYETDGSGDGGESETQSLSPLQEPLSENEKLIQYLERQDKTKTYLSLISSNVGNFTDLTPLLAFKDLEFLDIDNYELTDISGITVLSRHEKLSTLYLWAEKVTDLSPLSALVNLRTLNVDVANTYTDASELLPLVSLEELMFSPTSSKTIYNISQLIGLKRLVLYLYNRDIDLSPVQNLINLESLKMAWPDDKMTEFDISWIGRLVNLKELELKYIKIVDVSPLLKLPNLIIVNVMWSVISDKNADLLRKAGVTIYTEADKDH